MKKRNDENVLSIFNIFLMIYCSSISPRIVLNLGDKYNNKKTCGTCLFTLFTVLLLNS